MWESNCTDDDHAYTIVVDGAGPPREVCPICDDVEVFTTDE